MVICQAWQLNCIHVLNSHPHVWSKTMDCGVIIRMASRSSLEEAKDSWQPYVKGEKY